MCGTFSLDFDSIIQLGQSGAMTASDIAALAIRLADSGRRLTWESGLPLVDLASTGGPGSLSTLLTPLELRRLGCRVVKLSVPGRPAGAIDVLGTIPGYATRLDVSDVKRVLGRCGYVHFLADEEFAPMDAALFAYRREHGAIAVPALAAASLLSKKLAVGVQVVGLDVRVGAHGNFGDTMDEARENARLFCGAARLVGVDATAFLFEAGGAEQPWIGRGEALAAMEQVLSGSADGKLGAHATRCFSMAQEVARVAGILTMPDGGEGRPAILEAHLEAQGSSLSAFRERVASVTAAPHQPVLAETDGAMSVDLAILRDVLTGMQREVEARATERGRFADPAGLVMRASHGNFVRGGDVLAEVRVAVGLSPEWRRRITTAFGVHPGTIRMPSDIPMETIRA